MLFKVKARGADATTVAGCLFFVLALNAAVGGAAFNYALWSIAGKDAPWYADGLIGLFFGEFTIPAALSCWVLRLAGVAAPFLG